MFQVFFHAWERRLAAATTDRVVRPFDWGLEWLPSREAHHDAAPAAVLSDWVAGVMADTDRFFTPPPINDYTLGAEKEGGERALTFPSALTTPHPDNNVVLTRAVPRARTGARPSWCCRSGTPTPTVTWGCASCWR